VKIHNWIMALGAVG